MCFLRYFIPCRMVTGNFSFTPILSTNRQHALKLRTLHEVPFSSVGYHSNKTPPSHLASYNMSQRSSKVGFFPNTKQLILNLGTPSKIFFKRNIFFPISLTPLQLKKMFL